MVVEVVYERGALRLVKPLEGLEEGQRFDIEILPGKTPWKGALKELKSTSVELQNKIGEAWSNKYVSD
ncbi:DUF104 domain-containing protein [Candidatus Saganbacteria bacterium]|nr:DUF104 domain-containing protein [Candidatus Saganbacteria bacterium]